MFASRLRHEVFLDSSLSYVEKHYFVIICRYNNYKKSFQEHFRHYKYGNGKSKFAQHLLENRHSIGPMEDTMEIVYVKREGKITDTLQNRYIYKDTKMVNQINDKVTIKQNILFDTIIHRNSGTGHPMQQTPLCLTLTLFSCKPVRR